LGPNIGRYASKHNGVDIEKTNSPPYKSWGELIQSLGGGGEDEILEAEAPWRETQWGYATLHIRILSDEGGYHLIWEVEELPNHVVRAPKKGATPIRLGIENWRSLNIRLREHRLARVPEIMNVETAEANNAYIVERITRTVDALDMWEILQSTDIEAVMDKQDDAFYRLIFRGMVTGG
jgi:hypothetical protein